MDLGLTVAVLLLLAVLARIYWQRCWRRTLDLAADIPGPPTWPLIGNALQFACTPKEVFNKTVALCQQYGPVMKLWLGPKLYVLLSDPEDLQIILNSPDAKEKSPEYSFFVPWLGEGLFTSKGAKWETHRRLIGPAFHYRVLKEFIPVFVSNSLLLVDRLQREEGKPAFDVFEYMSLCTLDIILETAMGVRLNAQKNNNPHYVEATKKMCDIIHQRHYKVWLHSNAIFQFSAYGRAQRQALKILHSTSEQVISKKRLSMSTTIKEKDNDEGKIKKTVESHHLKRGVILEDQDVGEKQKMAFLDLLHVLTKDTTSFTEKDMKEEIDTLMFGGHETTAVTFSFLMMLLGLHQDVQERITEELTSIFGGSDRPPTHEDLAMMKYLERCLKETMRLFAIVPILGRRVTRDIPTKKYTLPAGCTVVLVSYLVHRDPATYPSPDKFDPDRFLPDRIVAQHPYSYIPFSAGPRNCLGKMLGWYQLQDPTAVTYPHPSPHPSFVSATYNSGESYYPVTYGVSATYPAGLHYGLAYLTRTRGLGLNNGWRPGTRRQNTHSSNTN